MQLNTIAGRTYNDLSQYPVVKSPLLLQLLSEVGFFFAGVSVNLLYFPICFVCVCVSVPLGAM